MKALEPVIKNGHFLAPYVDILKDERLLRIVDANVAAGTGTKEVHDDSGKLVIAPCGRKYMTESYEFDCVRLRRDAPDNIRQRFAEFAEAFPNSPVRFEA